LLHTQARGACGVHIFRTLKGQRPVRCYILNPKSHMVMGNSGIRLRHGVLSIPAIDGRRDSRRCIGSDFHRTAPCLNGPLIHAISDVFTNYAWQQLPVTKPEWIAVAWMAQRPP